jgi:hypothetical protein
VKPGVGAGGWTASLLAGRTPPPDGLFVSPLSESLGEAAPDGVPVGSGAGGVPGGGTALGGVAPGVGVAGSNGGGDVPGEGLVPAGVPGAPGSVPVSGAAPGEELVPGLGAEEGVDEGPLAPGAGEPGASGGT